jgi:hypothetical protein
MEHPVLFADSELELITTKAISNRLLFALLLAHYKLSRSFSDDLITLPPEHVLMVAKQIGLKSTSSTHDFQSAQRTWKRHRQEIRSFFGTRECSTRDANELSDWLRDHAVAETRDIGELTERLQHCCREQRLELPTPDRVERVIRTAMATYDERQESQVLGQLSPETKARLDALVQVLEGPP